MRSGVHSEVGQEGCGCSSLRLEGHGVEYVSKGSQRHSAPGRFWAQKLFQLERMVSNILVQVLEYLQSITELSGPYAP